MTKRDLLRLLEPFGDNIRIFVRERGAPNVDLMTPIASYVMKHGALRLQDGTLLEDGEGYIEVLV